jgi:hypothetical protein
VPFLKGGKHMLFRILLAMLALFPHTYGTVIEQTYEGYAEWNDYYIVLLDDGNIHEIEADDLDLDDRVTVYFFMDEPVRTLYGER